ncbi:hypothetical protein GCM10027347_44370 [Larkinella harenae]
MQGVAKIGEEIKLTIYHLTIVRIMTIASKRRKMYKAIDAMLEQMKVTELNKQPKNKLKEKERINNQRKRSK